jgi:hypothetical protein
MTAAELAALESLVGRPLIAAETEQIEAHIADPDDRRDDLIAALLSVGRTEVRATRVSEAGLLERWPAGPLAADAFLAKLGAFAATQHAAAGVVRRALRFMATPEGLDLGAAATHAMLDMLQAGGVVTADEVSAAKELSRHAAPVSIEQVSRALNLAQGRMVI